VLEPDSIFRVEQDTPLLRRPVRALGRAEESEKWFLIGHRGCGKSTYLRYLLSLEVVTESYCPLLYRISDVADLGDFGHQDLLFSLASQLVELGQQKAAIKSKLERRLENWGRTLVESVTHAEGVEVQVEGGLSAFFAKFFARLQTQHSTRKEFRRVVDPQIGELIAIIGELTAALEQRLGKRILIGIDDLDKVRLDVARQLFDGLVVLERPHCHIIYTVPVAIMHEAAWTNLRTSAWYVPNIKLHTRNDREARTRDGYRLMREFVEKRMDMGLITRDALREVITYGGGVFRQTCRLMQTAADLAEDEASTRITVRHVRRAVAEVANGLIDQLRPEDLDVLKSVAEDNDVLLGVVGAELLHNLSLLRYPNENHWHDVNPVLWEIVDGYQSDLDQ